MIFPKDGNVRPPELAMNARTSGGTASHALLLSQLGRTLPVPSLSPLPTMQSSRPARHSLCCSCDACAYQCPCAACPQLPGPAWTCWGTTDRACENGVLAPLARRCRFVVLGLEVGGRFGVEAATFFRLLACRMRHRGGACAGGCSPRRSAWQQGRARPACHKCETNYHAHRPGLHGGPSSRSTRGSKWFAKLSGQRSRSSLDNGLRTPRPCVAPVDRRRPDMVMYNVTPWGGALCCT